MHKRLLTALTLILSTGTLHASDGTVILHEFSVGNTPTPTQFNKNFSTLVYELNKLKKQLAQANKTTNPPMPKGSIILWSGNISSIPPEWALCDGDNKTPDLRARFIVGAGGSGIGTYAQQSKGDPDTHSHKVLIKSINGNTKPAGKHDHKFPDKWSWKNAEERGKMAVIDNGGMNPKDQVTQPEGIHSHELIINNISGNAKDSTLESRPKWFALAFIMKK